MNEQQPDRSSRKEALKSMIVLPALAASLAATAGVAEAKSSQAAMKYQKTPKNGAKCSTCKLFVPGKSATANGTCQVVDGAISPNGWCIAYTKK